LLKLKDVSAIAALEVEALQALTDAECRRLLKGESVTLTIKDEDEQIETENGDEEDEPEPLPRKRARNATASAVISTKGAKISNKTLNADGYDPITVYFDNYSGRGGYLRQYAVCKLHEVKEDLTLCRKYVYSKDFVSKARAAAFLVAWMMDQHEFCNGIDDATRHTNHNPSKENCEAVYAEWTDFFESVGD
jgi:hypothetical protein